MIELQKCQLWILKGYGTINCQEIWAPGVAPGIEYLLCDAGLKTKLYKKCTNFAVFQSQYLKKNVLSQFCSNTMHCLRKW